MYNERILNKLAEYLLMVDSGELTENEALLEIKDVVTRTRHIERSKSWTCLKYMPPLYHKLPNQDFDLEKSEVLSWISEQKEVLNWLLKSANKNNFIQYKTLSGQWQGVKYMDSAAGVFHD